MKEEKDIVDDIADVIGWALFISAILNFIVCFIFITVQYEVNKVFELNFLSLMCFGMAGIIFRLRK